MATTHTASASTAEATDLMRNSYSKAVECGQVYNNKLLEFAQANSKLAFDFAQKLIAVKSPSEFIELSTEHARNQFESLTEQTRELTALAQQVTLASAEPLKTGITKAFNNAA
jgi:hypothetical protein